MLNPLVDNEVQSCDTSPLSAKFPAECGTVRKPDMNELHNAIFEALVTLIQHDSDLIETQPKEECINHKLAQYLEVELMKRDLLGTCSVDVEYNKYKEDEKKASNGRNIRPDIIAHQRRSGSNNNLIVIEAKKGYDSAADRDKVIELVDSRAYQYSLGAVISYFPRREYLKVKFYERDEWRRYLMNKNSFEVIETKK